MDKNLQDKIRGALIGGAIGDALGYPVEFLSYAGIVQKYGNKGITRHELDRNSGKALISDDTQMALFTANGLLFGITRIQTRGGLGADLHDYVRAAYTEWYETQTGVRDYYNYHTCWIRDIKELNVRRAPGNTCMSALQSIVNGNEVINDSKGCGGVMRVAPVGCFMANQNTEFDWNKHSVDKYAAECAAITHKHPLGYIPAAVLANIVFRVLIAKEPVSKVSLLQIVESALADAREDFTKEKEVKAWSELRTQMNNAIRLSDSDIADAEAVKQLGEGWTGDEALTIAVYCALKHTNSFEDAIVAAVNQNGDSDSTGAICGNIMGAVVGYEAIPTYYVDNLEMRELIVDISDDLTEGCQINEYKHASTPSEFLWEQKYIFINPIFGSARHSYSITEGGKRALDIVKIESEYREANTLEEKSECCLKYALTLYDNCDFDPNGQVIFSNGTLHHDCTREFNPAYLVLDEEFKIQFRLACFKAPEPIVALRIKDRRNDLDFVKPICGIMRLNNPALDKLYPDGGWQYYLIDKSSVPQYGFATLEILLGKDCMLDVAMLGDDGKLHRIYSWNWI